MSHTPAPWTLSGHLVVAPNGTTICGMAIRNEENARLIAAAPDLLAVLIRVMSYSSVRNAIEIEDNDAALSAIKKAKGE